MNMKTKIEVINTKTGNVIFSRDTIGNSIKATIIAALTRGVHLPKNDVAFIS